MATQKPLSLPRILGAAGGIYTAQSLVGGLTFMGIPAVLRAENIGLDQIGLVSLAMLVWAVKFLWSAPVEHFRIRPNGARRSRTIILTGEAIVVLALIVLGLYAQTSFTVILSLLVVMAFASATVDIACDAFIIEQLPGERRGMGNVAQVGGGYLGLIFGSGLFVSTYSAWGWTYASLVLAALVVVMTLPMATMREPTREAISQTKGPSVLAALKRPEIRNGIVIAVVFEVGGRLAQALSGPFLVDAGLSLTVIGLLNGVGGVAAGLVGTFAGGFAVHRFGAKRAMFVVACLHVVTLAALAFAITMSFGNLPLLSGLFIVESAMMAAGFVVSYSRLMAFASPSQPGVDFTLFQCASAVAAALCGMTGGVIAANASYATTFTLAFVLAALAPVLLQRLENNIGKVSVS
jgi:MFS transporter, putative signal transducer